MTKRESLIFLLERYDDVLGLTGGQAGYRGDGLLSLSHARDCRLGRSLRCSCHQRSLVELDRALAELKAEAPVHHGHLVARYRQSVTVRRKVWFRDGGWVRAENERVVVSPFGAEGESYRGRTPATQLYDTVLVVWRPWVDLLIVVQALDRLEGLFRGDVWLPSEAAA